MTNDPRDVEAARWAYRYPPFVPTWDEAGTVPKSLILAAKYAREAAEARVAVLEGLLADYNIRILLAHDALEAARDKMRGAVEVDDQRVYDRVHTAIYVLRSRQSRALVAKLGRVDG